MVGPFMLEGTWNHLLHEICYRPIFLTWRLEPSLFLKHGVSLLFIRIQMWLGYSTGSLVRGSIHLEGTWYLWDIRNHSASDTLSYPRRHESLQTLLWDPQSCNVLLFFNTRQWTIHAVNNPRCDMLLSELCRIERLLFPDSETALLLYQVIPGGRVLLEKLIVA
jgi:hypothetical protein